jgi:hypothetical protein
VVKHGWLENPLINGCFYQKILELNGGFSIAMLGCRRVSTGGLKINQEHPTQKKLALENALTALHLILQR